MAACRILQSKVSLYLNPSKPFSRNPSVHNQSQPIFQKPEQRSPLQLSLNCRPLISILPANHFRPFASKGGRRPANPYSIYLENSPNSSINLGDGNSVSNKNVEHSAGNDLLSLKSEGEQSITDMGGGKDGSNGHGGGGGGDGGEDDGGFDAGKMGPIFKPKEIMREADKRGATLPTYMVAAALINGIWAFMLSRCFGLEFITVTSRVRLHGVQKIRAKDFWREFEPFISDMVKAAVSAALFIMLAPHARIMQMPPVSSDILGNLQLALAPSLGSVSEARGVGFKFSLKHRIAAYKGVVGSVSRLLGHCIVSLIMTANRFIKKSAKDIALPHIFKSAALWACWNNRLVQYLNKSRYNFLQWVLARYCVLQSRCANTTYGGPRFAPWLTREKRTR